MSTEQDQNVKSIILAITTPGEEGVVPVRQRDAFSTARTAVAQPFAFGRITWNPSPAAPPAANIQIPVSEMIMFLFRNPLRSYIIYDTNALQATWTYNWWWNNVTQAIPLIPGVTTRGKVTKAITTLAYQPHSDTMFAGFDNTGRRWIWVDAGATLNSTITVTFNADPGTNTDAIVLWRYQAGSIALFTRVNTATGTSVYNINISISDYYSFDFTLLSTAAATSCTILSTGTCSVFQHHYSPGITSNAGQMTGFRTNAASIKWTNTAAEQVLSGEVAACQYGKARSWTGIVDNTDPFNFVMGSPGAYSNSFKKGYFGFLKGQEDDDFRMQAPFTLDQTGTNWQEGLFPLENDAGMLAVCANVPLTNASDTYFTFRFGIEFTSTNTYFDMRPPLIGPDDWKLAMLAIASVMQHHENAVHFRDIISTIGRLAKVGGRILQLFPRTKVAGQIAEIGGGAIEEIGGMQKKRRR